MAASGSAEVPVWVLLAAPILTFAAGVATEGLRGWIGRSAASRDREAVADARRRTFQVETLIALQDALMRLSRLQGRTHIANEMEYREYGTWGRRTLPDDLGGEPAGEIHGEVTKLIGRVLDDQLRSMVDRVHGLCIRSAIGAMRDEPDDEAKRRCEVDNNEAMTLMAEVHKEIGRQLRELWN